MKRGLIVYNATDASKNQWFINKCLNELNNDETSLSYLDEDFLLDYISTHHLDFVIYRGRDYRLLEELEKRNIKTFNSSLTNKTANNKFLTFKLLKENNLPNIATYLDTSKLFGFPFIMKSVSGHGGSEVFLVDNIARQKAILEQNPEISFIYQNYLPNSGDVRIYVLDNKVIAAVKRENPHDYRNNFSLGGTANLFEPSQEMKEIALKVASLINATYVGVDFLLTNDGVKVIEIEDPVGSKMLYQASDIDIVSLYCQAIKRRI